MLRFYDRNRLVYLGKAASSEFWDEQWSSLHTKKRIESTRNLIITGKTKKYLPKGSRVLEGGCGQGQYVYLLEKSGFSTTGVDFGEKTVKKINELYPSLDIRFGNIRNMDFDDGPITVLAYVGSISFINLAFHWRSWKSINHKNTKSCACAGR